MARRAFFFPHQLDPGSRLTTRGGKRPPLAPPGRVPFRGTMALASADEVRVATAIVCADGYSRARSRRPEDSVTGPNQDPCIVTSPPFHSFCRLGRDHPRHRVRSNGRIASILSREVKEDDVIIYGKFQPYRSPLRAWIDTVLVVERIVTWPVHLVTRGTYRFSDPRRAEQALGTMPANGAYVFNLADAEKGGCHEFTRIPDHRIIVGRATPRSCEVADLRTSFVPLAEQWDLKTGWYPCHVDESFSRWDDLRRFLAGHIASEPRKSGYIAEFPSFGLCEALCRHVRARSGSDQGCAGFVAVPPIDVQVTHRWDPFTWTAAPLR